VHPVVLAYTLLLSVVDNCCVLTDKKREPYIWLSGFAVCCFRCGVFERSSKLTEFCNSFSILNFVVGCCLLNSVKVFSTYVFLWS
jgi:hypothetical protein